MAHGLLALNYGALDRSSEGLAHIEIAFRLSPRDPMAYLFFAAQALCKFAAGDFLGAISSAEKGISINPGASDNHFYMAAALSELGEAERSSKELERALRIAPKVNLHIIARGNPGAPAGKDTMPRSAAPDFRSSSVQLRNPIECLFMARNGHRRRVGECPFSGEERTSNPR
jgi:tetratricopeptide (TPR) repeat protein